jgi:hypothetical protein
LGVASELQKEAVLKALSDNGVPLRILHAEAYQEFYARAFHQSVVQHSGQLFLEGNYFHAVFESCKAYNRAVQEKSLNKKDGEDLMMMVWGWERGVLKVTA